VGDEWEMPRRGERCAGCQSEFGPGDVIQAYLFESPKGYERRDYCVKCRPPDEPFAIGSWKTRRPQPAARKAQQFDREAIQRFFEQLEDADTPEKRQLRFVLALLLWRKKVLKFERSAADGGREVWHFVAPRSGAAHAVVRPDLDEARLERLGEQLEGLLTGEVGDLNAVVTGVDEDHTDG
jgi:hypothetical protein